MQTNPPTRIDSHRNRNLDLIRAAAILMILVYHGVQMSPIAFPRLILITNFGQYGVDLFFVLSGWLIGGLYWRERRLFGDVSLLKFWVRRWMRTVPPYLAGLGLAWLAVYIVRSQQFDWAYMFFLQNYHEKIPFFLVSWSLCVEEHFYLLVPLMFALWRESESSRPYILVLGLAVIAPAAFRSLEYARLGDEFGYRTTATHLHMEGLILGFLLSYAAVYRRDVFARLQASAPWLAAISMLVLISLEFSGPRLRYVFWYTAISVFFSAVLVGLVTRREIGTAVNRVTAPIAIASYSVYLTHALAIHVARNIVAQLPEMAGLAYFPILVVTVIASAAALYYTVEKTCIAVRDAYWPRREIARDAPIPAT
jgi:peptidoglycan/LPS O-acetylase OafA/YrhL